MLLPAPRTQSSGLLRALQVLIPYSLSLAWRLGHAVAVAQHAKQDPANALVAEAGGRILFTGERGRSVFTHVRAHSVFTLRRTS